MQRESIYLRAGVVEQEDAARNHQRRWRWSRLLSPPSAYSELAHAPTVVAMVAERTRARYDARRWRG